MAVHIKICGFTRCADVETAVELGVDAFGLVLDPCPQEVPRTRIPELLRAGRGALSVAVTGPTDPEGISRTLDLGFDLVQAVMPIEDWRRLDPSLPALPVAFDGPDLLERVSALLALGRAPGPLGAVDVDGAGGGGRGVRADWSRAAECSRLGPLMLSGGLRADDVGVAIEAVNPWAVDVSSFTESSPGVKDPNRMRAFVAAVRAFESDGEPPRGGPHTVFSH